MRSLLVRIFLSFWLIIAVTLGTAALAGFWYAERVRDAFEEFNLGDSILDASIALEADGHDGLVRWLKSIPKTRGVTVYVIDPDFDDILHRPLPRGIGRMVDRHRRHREWRDHEHDRDDPRNLRRARPLTQLVAGNGDVYTVIAVPSRGAGQWSRRPAQWIVLLLALVVSAAVSFLLARAITRPVGKLRDATVAFAGGDMDTRVGASLGDRRDELGGLARDFDEMAEKLQRAAAQQTELSRNISHELRSPLARLRVALELARRQGGKLAEFDKIDDEAERLDLLIGQILSFTRFESAAADEKSGIDLQELIDGVVEDVNYECRSSGVENVSVVAELAGSVLMSGYRDALVSAFENVIRNAAHLSPADGQVSVTMRVKDGNTAIIEIIDQGPGVADTDLGQLFEPFFRTRRSTEATTQNGTGLGLAIARRAVQLNGGSITADNVAQGGLRITISLPLAD